MASNEQIAYAAAAEGFTKRNPASKQLYEKACESLPGGNVRTVLYYDPFPLSIVEGHGAKLTDADGHSYVDLLGEYTAGLYGHSDPVIAEAITTALTRGLSYGGQHENEARLAAMIEQRFPSIELLRFTNSGTESNLLNIALARAFTSKNKILVFDGCYHGGVLGWKAGVGSAINMPFDFLIAKYNDIDSVEDVLAETGNASDLAAIIVEPFVGAGGGIPAKPEFLLCLREQASKHGALLIFDEVMTSRMHEGGGIQSQLPPNKQPDLTSLGKYIGGGMSFGAFGGRRDIMALFDPRQNGGLAHAGTFNNNVFTMAAGCAGLERVFTPQRARELHERGQDLRSRLRKVCEGTLLQWTGLGSIICSHFTTTPSEKILSPNDLLHIDPTMAGLFHLWLLEHGFYIGRRGFIALSLAVTDQEISAFVDAVQQFIDEHKPLLTMN